MSFIKEIPAFQPPNSSIKPVYDRMTGGENVNSIPSDSGLLHSGTPRKHLTFREAPNNSVIQHYGAYIVMGTDRLGHLGTGAGASGYQNSDSVDIVVGRGANLDWNKGEHPGPPEGFIAGPMPTADAARIYISSKTNLDKHFGIATVPRDPWVGSNKHLLSGVALKADDVRMIARNNIKIVTGRNDGFTGGLEKNSLGGKSPQAGTISLIGGNYTDKQTKYAGLLSNSPISQFAYLQPAIKGDHLVECLNAMFTYVDLIESTLFNVIASSMGVKIAQIADPLMSPISKMEIVRSSGLDIPFGLNHAYEARAWALTQRRKYLEYGGDFCVLSANVYLT